MSLKVEVENYIEDETTWTDDVEGEFGEGYEPSSFKAVVDVKINFTEPGFSAKAESTGRAEENLDSGDVIPKNVLFDLETRATYAALVKLERWADERLRVRTPRTPGAKGHYPLVEFYYRLQDEVTSMLDQMTGN